MNANIDINAIWTSLTLIGLFYLIFWRLRILAVDWFRDKMFELRDDMFDAASGGLIDFNHPAYGTLRTTMNGYIRFCHKLSLLQMILLSILLRKKDSEKRLFSRNWNLVTKELDSKTLSRLENFRKQMETLVISYLVLSSPIISLLLYLVVLLGFAFISVADFGARVLASLAERIRGSKRMKEFLNDIEDTAYASGAS